MEVELNELKQFCIIPVKGSREKELVELNEYRMLLTIKFGIIVKTITSNERTVFWNSFVVLSEHVENNLMVSEVDYGLEKHCSRERLHQKTDKDDYESRDLRKTTTIDDKLKRPVVGLAPLFYESVFGRKTGPAMLAPVDCEIGNPNSNVTDETYNSKDLENLSRFEMENYMFHQKWCIPIKHHPPVPVNHSFNNLETWHTYSGGDTLTFHSEHPTPYLPWVQSN